MQEMTVLSLSLSTIPVYHAAFPLRAAREPRAVAFVGLGSRRRFVTSNGVPLEAICGVAIYVRMRETTMLSD